MTDAIWDLCMVVNLGGKFQDFKKSSRHRELGRLDNRNGTSYRALPLVPSFLGSPTSSTTIPTILMGSEPSPSSSRFFEDV